MRSFKITLCYDGLAYHGWQWQDGQPTIQEAIEQGIHQVTGQTARVTGSGRTDSGVHAAGQVAGFRVDTNLAAEVLGRAIHASTPHDIYILKCEETTADFHPIRDALGKRYRYIIQDAGRYDVLARHYAWQVPHPLDTALMQQGASLLQGTHDFAAFETTGSPRSTSVRTVRELTIERFEQDGFSRIIFYVYADGFLYNMVRNIVGSLVDVGRGSRDLQWLATVLANRDRRQAGATAPAHGLTLMQVDYETTNDPSTDQQAP
ncbi:MAG: tRNA pseudouridine(38-40) synthase TruA [Pirellulaceae bacterium]|nr:tRNA pseudouridine(38-40) synthase TruA [Pirellulaceae bacterium]